MIALPVLSHHKSFMTLNRMTEHSKPQISSGDEPLFVLKYRRSHVLVRIFCFSLGTLFFSGFALGAALIPEHRFHELILVVLGELVFALLLLSSILQIAHLLSFKEIRLYKDRIAQVSNRGNETEIRLADARLNGNRDRFGPIRIHDQDTAWFWGLFQGISYYEDLPHRREVLKLNYLLAALSGRNVQSFYIMKNERLIKEGLPLRALADSTLENLDKEIQWAFVREKRLRSEDRAWAVAAVVITLLPILCLAGWFIWIILT